MKHTLFTLFSALVLVTVCHSAGDPSDRFLSHTRSLTLSIESGDTTALTASKESLLKGGEKAVDALRQKLFESDNTSVQEEVLDLLTQIDGRRSSTVLWYSVLDPRFQNCRVDCLSTLVSRRYRIPRQDDSTHRLIEIILGEDMPKAEKATILLLITYGRNSDPAAGMAMLSQFRSGSETEARELVKEWDQDIRRPPSQADSPPLPAELHEPAPEQN